MNGANTELLEPGEEIFGQLDFGWHGGLYFLAGVDVDYTSWLEWMEELAKSGGIKRVRLSPREDVLASSRAGQGRSSEVKGQVLYCWEISYI